MALQHYSRCACSKCDSERLRKMKTVKTFRPWAAGFNGHARICDCDKCVKNRVKEFKKYYEEQARLPMMPDASRTVFVRPHWRRQPNHLKHQPAFRKALIKSFLK